MSRTIAVDVLRPKADQERRRLRFAHHQPRTSGSASAHHLTDKLFGGAPVRSGRCPSWAAAWTHDLRLEWQMSGFVSTDTDSSRAGGSRRPADPDSAGGVPRSAMRWARGT